MSLKSGFKLHNLASVLEDLPCGIAVLEGYSLHSASIIHLNSQLCKMFGYTEEEICSVGILSVVQIADEKKQSVLEQMEETLQKELRAELVYQITDRAATVRFISLKVNAVLLDAHGRMKYCLLFDDVTHIKQSGDLQCRRQILGLPTSLSDYGCQIFPEDTAMQIRSVGCVYAAQTLKELEKRYFDEIRFETISQSNQLIAKIRVNMSTNRVEYYSASDNILLQCQNCSWDTFLEQLVEKIPIEEQRKTLREFFNRETILDTIGVKPYRCNLEYQRDCNDGTVMWLAMTCRAYREPERNEVICHGYCYDVTAEKMKQQTFDQMTRREYEEIGILDLRSGNLQKLRFLQQQVEPQKVLINHYDDFIREYLYKYADKEELDELMPECLLSGVVRGLQKNDIHCVSFGITKNGQMLRKKVQYTYFDSAHRFILLAKSDITELFLDQKKQHEILRSALLQAQQASVAKSEFLSRVSHEIRTPMNAILGMTTLAEQCINKPLNVADCLDKIKISARFLLELLNDILDMSRIESGKVELKREKFSFTEFLSGINTICREQALEKDIVYESQLRTFMDDFYVGDVMKLQQVLVNIIFNAIKFTRAGGKVQFIISQESHSDDRAQLQFIISDTGIGISETFLPRLFEPFEQENPCITSQYNGTGLGLAICKNLVALMNGSIDVHSILGVGTKFVVAITLGTLPMELTKQADDFQLSVAGRHALIVDDEIMDCKQLKKLCGQIGLKADWVDSGAKAVERVRRKMIHHEFYDIVLIDWRMPEMDGAATVRCIRKVVGEQTPILIVSAYDQSEIETLAIEAGADVFLAKPLEKDSFLQALRRGFHKHETGVPTAKEMDYDFSACRALLVEDHTLNIEVAKRLLNAKHMSVEVAKNGLAALEMFVRNPDGYYDVILMDIRMPLMDGLTAARAIRQTSHLYAKTVPIIAMSANAFDEDIEKSRSAGMNAHLAKPFDPRQLYHVLYAFIERCKEDKA